MLFLPDLGSLKVRRWFNGHATWTWEETTSISTEVPESMIDIVKLELLALRCKGTKFYDPCFAERLKGLVQWIKGKARACIDRNSTSLFYLVAISLLARTSLSAGTGSCWWLILRKTDAINYCCICGKDESGGKMRVGDGGRRVRQIQVWADLLVAGTETLMVLIVIRCTAGNCSPFL